MEFADASEAFPNKPLTTRKSEPLSPRHSEHISPPKKRESENGGFKKRRSESGGLKTRKSGALSNRHSETGEIAISDTLTAKQLKFKERVCVKRSVSFGGLDTKLNSVDAPETPTPGSPASPYVRDSQQQVTWNPHDFQSRFSSTSASVRKRAPPSTVQVLKTSVTDIVKGAKATRERLRYYSTKMKAGEPFNVQLHHLAQAVLIAFAVTNLFLVKILNPKPWWLLFFIIQGAALGLLLSFVYYYNIKRKAEINNVLGSNLGMKGLNFLLGGLPSWLSYTKSEKVKWMNRTIEEVWPQLDKGASVFLKEMMEWTFGELKRSKCVPSFVKSLEFHNFVFGDAPFRVESIKVSDRHGKEEAMSLEMDVRWCGDANIAMSIAIGADAFDLLGIHPTITDIRFAGSLNVVLLPLKDEIPGFGIALVTFRRPPQMNYSLKFRKGLGSGLEGIVKSIVDYILEWMITSMLVWPQRMLFPIMKDMEHQLERLGFRPCGLMKVVVMRAKDLPKSDVIGSSDPLVEMTTDGKHKPETRCIKNTLNPEWMETHYVMIHEPTREHLKITMYDLDAFSPGEIFKLNFKDVVESREFMCRALVNVAPITAQEGIEYEQWYDLGDGPWDQIGGCGSGKGELQLACTYLSYKHLKLKDLTAPHRGILIVRIIYATDLPRGVGNAQTMTVASEVRCGKQRDIVAWLTSDKDFRWTNWNTATLHNISSTSTATLSIFDKTHASKQDVVVGKLDFHLPDVIASNDVAPLTGVPEPHYMVRSFKLKCASSGWMTVRVRFVPYF